MKAVLIQQIYPDTEGVKMLELTHEYHAGYCKKHDIDFRWVIDNPIPSIPPEAGSWGKIQLIRKALQDGYEAVIWLDADTLICDLDTDLRDAIQVNKIGACWQRIPQLHHWNVGALYVHNSEQTRDFISKWLASYPPTNKGWMEQGEFNRLARESRTVVTLSDKWNATIAVSMVPDAVVLGFHGQGDTPYRIKIMADAMIKLSEKKAKTQDIE